MADEWFYQRNGQRFGPITSIDLRQMAIDGLLWPIDLVTKAGMTTWVEASKVKGLFTNNAPQAIQAPQINNGPSVNSEQNISNRAPTIPPPINEPFPFTENTVPQVASPIPSKPTLGSSIFSGLLQPTKPANVPTNQTPTVSTPAITTPLIPRLPFGLDPNAVILDHPVIYQGGHPALHKKADGRLLLTDNYILFVGESAADDLSFPFDSCKDLSKPAVGSFPQKLIDQANTTKAMADIGKSVAKFAGTWMGGSGGRLVKAAGGAGSDVAKGTTALGAPPKNRLTVVFLDSSKYPHKVLFDVSGSSKAEMEKRAEEIWMRISPFRPKFAGVEKPDQDVRKTGKVPTQSISGSVSSKSSYRILNPGTPVETVTGQELSQRLASGEVGLGTLVCLEFWVPIHMASNFGIFGSIGTGGSGRGGQGTQGRNGDAGISGPDPDGAAKGAGKSCKKRGGEPELPLPLESRAPL
jgi:hypothetical protein